MCAQIRPEAVEEVFREVYGQAVARLIRLFGDIGLAEDAVQDAFEVAERRWPDGGVPPNPAGWIVTTARNRAIDQLRRRTRGRELEARAGDLGEDLRVDDEIPDDRLRLIFTCCHPALPIEHRVALTLRLLGGLTVVEIARSFLVSEAAMAKRLVRAKYKIKAANIPYRVPPASELPRRLDSVLAVIYLVYNSGADDPVRRALRIEAIRLARALVALLPEEPEPAGLLALLILSEARMSARRSGDEPILLRRQDRRSWDRALIDEGQAIVRTCIERRRPGPYQLQAAIQAVHCDAATFEQTDWRQIVELYDHLFSLQPSPTIALNRAIALAEVAGPHRALEAIDAVGVELDGYHLFHAARGEMLDRIGNHSEARSSFERATTLAPGEPERRFLSRRTDQVGQ